MQRYNYHPMASIDNFNLFCFPFAGGSQFSYNDFDKHMPEHARLIKIDLPGHGKRIGEPLLSDVDAIVFDLLKWIGDDLHEPYAFFGHSFGALVSYRLAALIAGKNIPDPLHLFVSGQQGPSVAPGNKDIHLLPREAFIEKVVEYGGIPEEVSNNRDLMDFVEPMLRADFQAEGTYVHKEEPPLDAPITVMVGSDDDVSLDDALKWQEVTTRKIVLKQFPGDHFFVFDHLPEICDIISTNSRKG